MHVSDPSCDVPPPKSKHSRAAVNSDQLSCRLGRDGSGRRRLPPPHLPQRTDAAQAEQRQRGRLRGVLSSGGGSVVRSRDVIIRSLRRRTRDAGIGSRNSDCAVLENDFLCVRQSPTDRHESEGQYPTSSTIHDSILRIRKNGPCTRNAMCTGSTPLAR
jgi:hypothetical protein